MGGAINSSEMLCSLQSSKTHVKLGTVDVSTGTKLVERRAEWFQDSPFWF